MIEYMLSNIIAQEFEKVVGKFQHDSRKALHVGFNMSVGNSTNQYRVCHMYLFAPANYVHVTVQEETIDEAGDRHIEPMLHLCCHDSCWRDALQSFIFKHSRELNGFHSILKMFDWYDVLILTPEECEYLSLMNKVNQIGRFGNKNEQEQIKGKLKANPFDRRSVWNEK